ncbi:hypothetical protein Tco_0849114 [Tanacetum coccineum]
MAPFEMLYGRKCKTPVCWGEVGKRELTSTYVIQTMIDMIDLIRECLKEAQSQHKSYADRRIRPIEFRVGDFVMLKCLADETVFVSMDEVVVDDKLNYVKESKMIIDQKVNRLRNREFRLVKVQWKHHKGPNATWELEDEMRENYSHLFV